MDRQNLEFTIRELPRFVPPRKTLYSYPSILQALRDCHNAWPELVSVPRPLVRSKAGQWVYVVTIGHGDLYTIIEVMPHGGELLWLQGSWGYTLFLCAHPWLLEGRTIHLLFSGPDEAMVNFDRWGHALDLEHPVFSNIAFLSLSQHFRHPRMTWNHCWAYPLGEDSTDPESDARAGMILVEELALAHANNSNVLLVSWIAGHNEHVAWGAQFHLDGLGAARSGHWAERMARRLGVPLNPGPSEETCMRRYPGTVASWTFPAACDLVKLYPGAELGSSGPEWARRKFPGLCAKLVVE